MLLVDIRRRKLIESVKKRENVVERKQRIRERPSRKNTKELANKESTKKNTKGVKG